MASISRLRLRLRLRLLPIRRHLTTAASILNPSDPSNPLTSHQKSRKALSLLRSEKDPSRIAAICRAAALTPQTHLDRLSLSSAVSSLPPSAVRSLVDDLLLSPNPDLSSDRNRSHAIVLFGQAGMLDDSIRTFKDSDPPSTRSLNALLFACILANKHDEAARIFRDFPAKYGVTPNLETYNTVIKSFCESGTSRSFYSMIDEMGRMQVKPNLTTFSTAIAGFYKEERLEEIDKVLQLMKKLGYTPGLSIYNVRLQSLCKLKRVDEAMELFKEMVGKRVKMNWVTYNHIIFGFCSVGDLAQAKRLYEEMRRKKIEAGSRCYFTLIYYLCKGGDFDAALELCKECLAKNWAPHFSTMRDLVNGLVSVSKVEEAREIIGMVKEKFSSNFEMWKEVEEGLPQ